MAWTNILDMSIGMDSDKVPKVESNFRLGRYDDSESVDVCKDMSLTVNGQE